jgi:hypothetical protein
MWPTYLSNIFDWLFAEPNENNFAKNGFFSILTFSNDYELLAKID